MAKYKNGVTPGMKPYESRMYSMSEKEGEFEYPNKAWGHGEFANMPQESKMSEVRKIPAAIRDGMYYGDNIREIDDCEEMNMKKVRSQLSQNG